MANSEVKVVLTAVDKLTGPLASAQRSISHFASSAASLSGTLIGLGGALSGLSIAGFVKTAIDGADAMGKMAQSAGVGVAALSGLAHAAKLSDVSLESLGTGMARLNKSISESATGTGAAAKAFKALGVSVKDSSGALKSADTIISEIADEFAGMKDGATKTALAMDLFGRSGANMIPMLNSGADGLKAMADEAQRLGLIIDEDAARAAEDFNDNLTRLKGASEGLAISLANDALPALSEITKAMAEAAKEGGLLKAAWVGLGGIGAAIFTDEFVDPEIKAQREIINLRAELGKLQGLNGLGKLIYGDTSARIGEINGQIAAQKTIIANLKKQADAERLASAESVKAAAARAAAVEEEIAASNRKAAVDKARQERAQLIARYMDRELDAAIKLQDAMVKAYDDNLINQRVAAEKRLSDEVDRTNEMLDDRALAESDSLKTLEDLVVEMELETELLGLSNEAREEAILMRKLEVEGINLTSEALAEYRVRLTEALRANQAASATREAADAAADEWKRASDNIEQSLTDALMRGFEGGKDFASNFKDTLKNLFNTLILKPVIQPIAQGGASMVTGMMGMGASGSAMAGGDILGMGSSLLSGMAPGAISTTAGVWTGGIAEMLGASSSTAGALGAGVATALPWLGAAVAIGSLFGLFGGKPSNKAAGGSYDFGTDSIGDLWNMTGDKQASQETMDARSAVLDSIAGFDAMVSALGGSLSQKSIGVDIGERDGVQFSMDGGALTSYGSDPNEAVAKLFRELALESTGLSESLQTLLGYFEGTAEELLTFGGALVTLQDYAAADPMLEAAEAAEEAGRSAWEVWQQQGVDLRESLAAWDGSAQAASELATLTQSRYQTELALAQQINAALTNTSLMFDSTIDGMKFGILDIAGQYEFLRDKSKELEASLAQAVDPAEIESLSKQLNDTAIQAWQLLGEEERKVKINEYEKYLDEMEALTLDRLNAAGAVLGDERNEDLPTSITVAIETAMARVADQFMAAANAQQAAANTPITVDVNVDVPANVEVGIGG